jgi:hypothetical protein
MNRKAMTLVNSWKGHDYSLSQLLPGVTEENYADRTAGIWASVSTRDRWSTKRDARLVTSRPNTETVASC